MKYRLIFTDIDGTLLNTEKKVLPQVKESLKKAKDAGMEIVLASGRMPSGVQVVERELGIKCIKICNAGSYILDGEKCIGAKYFTNSTMERISKTITEKRGIPLWIFRELNWYVTGKDGYIEREIGFVEYVPEVVDAAGLAGRWEKEGKAPNKLVIAAEPEMIQEIYREIEMQDWEDVAFACSADHLLEVFPKGVDKGTALHTICKELGISPEQTVAFGDHELDIPLIEAAGFGVAMGNAIEEVKEKADFVTKSNDEAGVAYALEQYLGQWA